MKFMDLVGMTKSLLARAMIPFMEAMETIISNQELATIQYMVKVEMILFTSLLEQTLRMEERVQTQLYLAQTRLHCLLQ